MSVKEEKTVILTDSVELPRESSETKGTNFTELCEEGEKQTQKEAYIPLQEETVYIHQSEAIHKQEFEVNLEGQIEHDKPQPSQGMPQVNVNHHQQQQHQRQQQPQQQQFKHVQVQPPFLPCPPEMYDQPIMQDPNGRPLQQQGQHITRQQISNMNPPLAFLPVVSGSFPQQVSYMAVPVNVNQLYASSLANMGNFDQDPMKGNRKRKRKNRLCGMVGCDKNARGRTQFCVRHGGGIRCSMQGCEKGARPHSTLCSAHGGGHRCLFNACNKGALAKSVYCRRHGKVSQSPTPPIQML